MGDNHQPYIISYMYTVFGNFFRGFTSMQQSNVWAPLVAVASLVGLRKNDPRKKRGDEIANDIARNQSNIQQGGPLPAINGVINPLIGVINPLIGVINPLIGVINPLIGVINPLRGVINPLIGVIIRVTPYFRPFIGPPELRS